MIKPILAITAAAVCAVIFVLAPEFAPKSAMAETQSNESGALARVVVAVKEQPQSDGRCLEHWPFYEQSCLRDERLPNGVTRGVRVIAIGYTDKP